MHIKNKRGQSTVEYVLLMTAVVVVIIAFVTNSGKSGFQGQLNSTFSAAAGQINSETDLLTGSHDSGSAPNGDTVGTPPYTVNPASGV